jgi:hypothetical protein
MGKRSTIKHRLPDTKSPVLTLLPWTFYNALNGSLPSTITVGNNQSIGQIESYLRVSRYLSWSETPLIKNQSSRSIECCHLRIRCVLQRFQALACRNYQLVNKRIMHSKSVFCPFCRNFPVTFSSGLYYRDMFVPQRPTALSMALAPDSRRCFW